MWLSLCLLFLQLASVHCTTSHLRAARRTATDPNAPSRRCPSNWLTTRDEYAAAMHHWTDPQCYDMVFRRACMCTPDWVGPFAVSVRNGRVVGPDLSLPTMMDIMETVFVACLMGCPDEGASWCQVTYGEYGYVERVSITGMPDTYDDVFYTVSNFTICEDGP